MGKKILIIDDESELVQLLRIELEKEGYRILSAGDGQAGYETYLKVNPDLIILDLNLPKLNGFEVCRKIRRDNEDNQTPIIMLTAKKEDSDRIVGRVIGAETYMTKPFQPEELLAEVKTFLGE